jgi:DNA primase
MDLSQIAQQIKSRIDIVDFISDYLELKKAGRNFKGLCPFHAEKSPSFTVSPERQMFHCFGCGVGGDIVGFMMKEQNLSFPQAVERLAERAGVVIENNYTPSTKTVEKRKGIYDALELSREYFIKSLNQSEIAKNYIQNRGLSEEIIKEFSVGYAPRTNDLYKLLKNKGFTDTLLASSGVIATGEKGLFDMFRGRVVFPIVDHDNRVIAFGGRVIDDGMPKYLNSPDTDIFHKGQVLFGFYAAKETIRKKKYVVIVEGYMDAIVCHMYGVKNTVAPLGTALTEAHVKMIGRYAKNILLVFDGDVAGINAAKRSLDIIYRGGLTAKVLLLPDKGDPDSFLREHGVEKFKKMMSKARGFIDFRIDIDGNNSDAMRDVYLTISNISDAVVKGSLITDLSNKGNISESALRERIKDSTGKNKQNKAETGFVYSQPSLGRTRAKGAEEILLCMFFNYYKDLEKYLGQIILEYIENPVIKKIFIEFLKSKEVPNIDRLREICDINEINYVSGLLVDVFFDENELEQIITQSISTIKKNVNNKELYKIERQIKNSTDVDETNRLLKEIQRLKKESL